MRNASLVRSCEIMFKLMQAASPVPNVIDDKYWVKKNWLKTPWSRGKLTRRSVNLKFKLMQAVSPVTSSIT